MQKTVKIGKSKLFFMNIPTEIAKRLNLQKGETALVKVVDDDTFEVKIIED